MSSNSPCLQLHTVILGNIRYCKQARKSVWRAELDWLSVPLLKGKFLVRIQMFSKSLSSTKNSFGLYSKR